MSTFNHEHDFVYPNHVSECRWPPSRDNGNQTNPHHVHRTPSNLMEIRANILDCIGNTPLVRLNTIPAMFGVKCEILAKCEFLNPGGSVKDRIGYRMVLEAERKGLLVKGRTTIIEPTSGNTGIGIALASAVRGYKCIIVMPEKMSAEKVNVLRVLGAIIYRTPTEAAFDSPHGLVSVAQKLCKETPDSLILNQYVNAGNPLAHYDGTATEILEQCDGNLTAIVCGAGTGGTITGIGRKIKEHNPTVRVIGVDPHGSILAQPDELNRTPVPIYQVEGIGYDFIPTVLDRNVIDEWMKVNDRDAFAMARNLVRYEGFLCGGSSGAAMWAAIQVAKTLTKTDRLVVILPDNIRNYLSKYAQDDWMYAWNFFDAPKPFQSISDSVLTKLASKATILPNRSVREALKLMQDNDLDHLPVVTENQQIEGVLTLKNVLKKLLDPSTNKCWFESPDLLNSTVLERLYRKVPHNTRLDQIVRHLQIEPFVILVNENDKYVGTATLKDLSNEVLSNNVQLL